MTKSPTVSALSALKRHFWAGLAAFTSVMGASIAYLSITPPTYESSARLMVRDNSVSVSDLGQLLTRSTPPRDVNPVASQAELVKSQRVLQRAQTTMQQEQGVSARKLPSITEIQEVIKVEIVPATNILQVNYEHTSPTVVADFLNAIANAMVIENTEAIRAEASAVRKFLEGEIPRQRQRLQTFEQAEQTSRQTNNLVDPNTQSQTLVNSLAMLEQDERELWGQLQGVATRNRLLQQVTASRNPEIAYLVVQAGQNKELATLQAQLTDLEVAVIDSQSRLGDQHPDLLALLQKREELRQLYVQQLAQLTGGNASVTGRTLASNPLSQELLAQYITGDIERRALESQLQTMRTERNQLQQQISQFPALQQPLTTLVREREEAEAAQKLLQSKLQEAQIAEAQLTGTIQVVGYAMVPVNPVAPRAPVVLIMGFMMGATLAIGVILAMEILDLTLHNPAEAEELLQLPVLGSLPQAPAHSSLAQFLEQPEWVEPYRALLKTIESRAIAPASLVEHRLGSDYWVEQKYSTVGSTVGGSRSSSASAVGTFSGESLSGHLNHTGSFNHSGPLNHSSHLNHNGTSKRKPRVIVVSSTVTGEGKSHVALYLAAISAMLSRRTLLIDADLRHPLQHTLLNRPAAPGLTDVVNNPNALTDVVQATSIENLFLLSQGQRISRPATLVESESLPLLLANAGTDYDLIVVDTSPSGFCADAAILSRYTDGMVFVVKPHFAARSLIHQTVNQLKQNYVTVLGTVLNETVTAEEKEVAMKP